MSMILEIYVKIILESESLIVIFFCKFFVYYLTLSCKFSTFGYRNYGSKLKFQKILNHS